ncbi:MAG: hypothetical protein CO002_00325 [Candidatus Portnoybacteria bacterium CG_4_8_14_3_um_filter_44_10]|uniref:Uncharacterized protein n=3 Tax=Candidatus Portnoyibacteriota TaxID=1817913 RepID=A0A2H0KQ36_9BACT|nr:MAG: hypothetical protein AUK17_03430 [Parcubacteria group bacterium CG2_30_44_18]PIQ74278.1 MAG: hypothetical protein COV85_02980 [Candidatus Portnoybacteria bacterium CG11_big_fil_rev_8_21_14_0_20_44_10]PIS16908.1 MAG: hypothetical protein COT61_01465 [Candidatus Portnoybacteria bacterium CG09_land_8_20_14_0_10_44_13]PIW75749.1 MAG: hypothetical protein CO002_00325 [Candidatus Portnoybacteria bacterium CG_4_8_14_3_um_filter_44_10]
MSRIVVPHEDFLAARERLQARKAQKEANEREPGWALFTKIMRLAKDGHLQEKAEDLAKYLAHVRHFDITKEELDDDRPFIEQIIFWHRRHHKIQEHECQCGGGCGDCETNILFNKIKAAALDESFSRHQAVTLIQWLRVLYKGGHLDRTPQPKQRRPKRRSFLFA